MFSLCRTSAPAGDDTTAEVEVLKGRLADAATKNKKLLALVHQQHGQIQVLDPDFGPGTIMYCWSATAGWQWLTVAVTDRSRQDKPQQRGLKPAL